MRQHSGHLYINVVLKVITDNVIEDYVYRGYGFPRKI